jgi:hypothetical protein
MPQQRNILLDGIIPEEVDLIQGGAKKQLVEALGRKAYGCVVSGGGVRKLESNLALF